MNKIVRNILIGLVALFLLIQLVPYGRNHDNPPVVKEPNWDSAQTRELAARACFDCHSHENEWPLYSNVAPVSWFVYHHVEDGRKYLNFSDWGNFESHSHSHSHSDDEATNQDENKQDKLIGEITKSIKRGSMPLDEYLWLHPEADLSNEEKTQLIEGLAETVRNSPLE